MQHLAQQARINGLPSDIIQNLGMENWVTFIYKERNTKSDVQPHKNHPSRPNKENYHSISDGLRGFRAPYIKCNEVSTLFLECAKCLTGFVNVQSHRLRHLQGICALQSSYHVITCGAFPNSSLHENRQACILDACLLTLAAMNFCFQFCDYAVLCDLALAYNCNWT